MARSGGILLMHVAAVAWSVSAWSAASKKPRLQQSRLFLQYRSEYTTDGRPPAAVYPRQREPPERRQYSSEYSSDRRPPAAPSTPDGIPFAEEGRPPAAPYPRQREPPERRQYSDEYAADGRPSATPYATEGRAYAEEGRPPAAPHPRQREPPERRQYSDKYSADGRPPTAPYTAEGRPPPAPYATDGRSPAAPYPRQRKPSNQRLYSDEYAADGRPPTAPSPPHREPPERRQYSGGYAADGFPPVAPYATDGRPPAPSYPHRREPPAQRYGYPDERYVDRHSRDRRPEQDPLEPPSDDWGGSRDAPWPEFLGPISGEMEMGRTLGIGDMWHPEWERGEPRDGPFDELFEPGYDPERRYRDDVEFDSYSNDQYGRTNYRQGRPLEQYNKEELNQDQRRYDYGHNEEEYDREDPESFNRNAENRNYYERQRDDSNYDSGLDQIYPEEKRQRRSRPRRKRRTNAIRSDDPLGVMVDLFSPMSMFPSFFSMGKIPSRLSKDMDSMVRGMQNMNNSGALVEQALSIVQNDPSVIDLLDAEDPILLASSRPVFSNSPSSSVSVMANGRQTVTQTLRLGVHLNYPWSMWVFAENGIIKELILVDDDDDECQVEIPVNKYNNYRKSSKKGDFIDAEIIEGELR